MACTVRGVTANSGDRGTGVDAIQYTGWTLSPIVSRSPLSSWMDFFISMVSPQSRFQRMREKPVKATFRSMTESLLILTRGTASQRRVLTTRTMPPLRTGEDLPACFLTCRKVISSQPVNLQAARHDFDHCGGETIVNAAHRAGEPAPETAVRKGCRDICSPAARVVEHLSWMSLRIDQLRCLEHQGVGQRFCHCPSDHLFGEHIRDRRQVQPSFIRGEVCHVC